MRSYALICNISIHPPLAGRDLYNGITRLHLFLFQSTRPLRGGTPRTRCSWARMRHFNPPAPCGAGLLRRQGQRKNAEISIHPPLAGRDRRLYKMNVTVIDFNPPAPCGAGLFVIAFLL